MALISMAKQKAAAENQDLQNLQQNMQTPMNIQNQQQQPLPTINSVFGN